MPCAVLHVLGCTAAVLADYKDMVFPSCGEHGGIIAIYLKLLVSFLLVLSLLCGFVAAVP